MGGKKICQHLQKGDRPHQHWKRHEDKAEQSNVVQKSRLPCSSAFCHHCQHLHWELSTPGREMGHLQGGFQHLMVVSASRVLFPYLIKSLQKQMIENRHQINFTRAHPSPPGHCLSLSLVLNLAACCSHCSTWLSLSVAETSLISV